MILTGEIGNIIFKDSEHFGIKVYQDGDVMDNALESECIVVLTGKSSDEKYWSKVFVNVNFCIPDYREQKDKVRLDELERKAKEYFKQKTGTYDGTLYTYRFYSSSQEKAHGMGFHYVNIILLFKSLNTK